VTSPAPTMSSLLPGTPWPRHRAHASALHDGASRSFPRERRQTCCSLHREDLCVCRPAVSTSAPCRCSASPRNLGQGSGLDQFSVMNFEIRSAVIASPGGRDLRCQLPKLGFVVFSVLGLKLCCCGQGRGPFFEQLLYCSMLFEYRACRLLVAIRTLLSLDLPLDARAFASQKVRAGLLCNIADEKSKVSFRLLRLREIS